MYSKTVIASLLAAAGLASAQTSINAAQSSALISAYSSYFRSVFTDASFASAIGGLATNTAVLGSLSGVLAAATAGGAVPTDLAALSSLNSVIDTLPSAQANAIHSLIAGEVSIAQSVLSTTAIIINASTTATAGGAAATGGLATITSNGSTMTTTTTPTGTAALASTSSKAAAAPLATGVKVAGLGAAAFGAVVALL